MEKILLSGILFILLQSINGLICFLSLYLLKLHGDVFKLIALAQGFTNQLLIIFGFIFVDRISQSKISENRIAIFNKMLNSCRYFIKSHGEFLHVIDRIIQYNGEKLHPYDLIELKDNLKKLPIFNISNIIKENKIFLERLDKFKIKRVLKITNKFSRISAEIVDDCEKLLVIPLNERGDIIKNLKVKVEFIRDRLKYLEERSRKEFKK